MSTSSLLLLCLLLAVFTGNGIVVGSWVDKDKCEYPENPLPYVPFDRYGREASIFCTDACGGKEAIKTCRVDINSAFKRVMSVKCVCEDSVEMIGSNDVHCTNEIDPHYTSATCYRCSHDAKWYSRNLKNRVTQNFFPVDGAVCAANKNVKPNPNMVWHAIA